MLSSITPCCPSPLYWTAAPCTHGTRSPCGGNRTATRLPSLTRDTEVITQPRIANNTLNSVRSLV